MDDNLSKSDLDFYSQFFDRRFDDSCCFFCAESFENTRQTSEHVIPVWAQSRYNLWNQRLTLLNGTTIPYRMLTVPCCEECNNYVLQPIETAMSMAVQKGHNAVKDLGYKTIFLWLGKIFYGLLYKELFLKMDRKKGECDAITSPEVLKEYEMHLLFLQEARKRVVCENFNPGSIFVFSTQVPQIPELQWDFNDRVETMFLAVRMGSVGIISVLQDGGAQELCYKEAYKELNDLPLHPAQFLELCAQFAYRSTLATRTPKYMVFGDNPHRVIQMPLGGYSNKPFFEEWNPATYARHLSCFMDIPYEYVYESPNKVRTWLHDPSGKVKYFDYEKNPY